MAMTDDIASRVGDTIQARLTGVDGLAEEIWRNRGRLAVWKQVAGAAEGQNGYQAINVMDGDPRLLEELIAHETQEVEAEQDVLVDFLVYHEEDAARSQLYRAGLRLIVDSVLPRIPASTRREHTLGGLVDWIELSAVEREGLVLDTSPFIIGAGLRFKFLFSAEDLLG